MTKRISMGWILFFFLTNHVFSQQIEYVFPKDGSPWIEPKCPVIVRFSEPLSFQKDLLPDFIEVSGKFSGNVDGQTVLSPDGKTLRFKPGEFPAGDTITVRIRPILEGCSEPFVDTTLTFAVSTWTPEDQSLQKTAFKEDSTPSIRYAPNADGVLILNGISVPSDFPYIHITVNDYPDPGYIFCNNDRGRHFDLILDDSGNPIFYWVTPDDRRDFQLQPNGRITMTVREGFNGGGFIAIDTTYAIVDTFYAPEGYVMDEHELVVLPNGHYLMTAFDQRVMDLSQVVPGGKRNALVTGYHLIEMDEYDQPYFYWLCWNNYLVTDAQHLDLTAYSIDYLHMNAIAVDLDGHYILNPRNLDEITKINRFTGEMMWRMGGKHNQFTFNGFENGEFVYMAHAVNVLENGNFTIFDNGNYHSPPYSRALEFRVDEEAKTVTQVWEFKNSPSIWAQYKGNVQRLPSGNTLINWGEAGRLTEVRPDGSKAFEMRFQYPIQSYRMYKFPWTGKASVPFLTFETYSDRVHLLFNKFGDSDVSEYRIYGGPAPRPFALMGTTEQPYLVLTQEDFTESSTYYFRVTAVDAQGHESGFSNEEEVRTFFHPANTNLVQNGEFGSGMSHWSLDLNNSASASAETGEYECHVAINSPGTALSDIRLLQENLTLYNNEVYTLEFDAWASQPRVIDPRIALTASPFTTFTQIGYQYLTTERKRYRFSFLMEGSTTHQAAVIFQMGMTSDDVYIDHVVLTLGGEVDVSEKESNGNANTFQLSPAYPNPFNPSTTIRFSIPETSEVSLELLDIRGRLVSTLSKGRLKPGVYLKTIEGFSLGSGTYICRLKAVSIHSGKQMEQTQKVLLIK